MYTIRRIKTLGDVEQFVPSSPSVEYTGITQRATGIIPTSAPASDAVQAEVYNAPAPVKVYNEPIANDFAPSLCPRTSCPKGKPWYIFVLLGAVGGGLAVGGGMMIREARRKRR